MNIEAEQRKKDRAEDAVSREQMGLPKSTKLIASGRKETRPERGKVSEWVGGRETWSWERERQKYYFSFPSFFFPRFCMGRTNGQEYLNLRVRERTILK